MTDKAGTATPKARGTITRGILQLICIMFVVIVAKLGFDWLTTQINMLETDQAKQAMTGLIVAILLGYAVLIAIPFVPGVEIGATVLMVQGAEAAPLVYLATMLGMSLAFLTGQFLSLDWMITRCDTWRMVRLCKLIHRIKETPMDDRLASLKDRLPRWLAPFVVNYRYLSVAIIINTPGSVAIGGGGGIMLASGLSRLFKTGWMMATIALATLPIPLAVWIMGTDILH